MEIKSRVCFPLHDHQTWLSLIAEFKMFFFFFLKDKSISTVKHEADGSMLWVFFFLEKERMHFTDEEGSRNVEATQPKSTNLVANLVLQQVNYPKNTSRSQSPASECHEKCVA